MLTKERKYLLELIRLGILTEDVESPSFSDVDWDVVLKESFQQGVGEIACDGIKRINKIQKEGATVPRKIFLRWVGQTIQHERRYNEQLLAAQRMGAWMADKGIKTVVLKGFTVAECYPIPSHRYSSDMDCFLLKVGEHFAAWEDGNRVVEAHGIEVERKYYKNSAFDVDELHVENHKFITPFRGNKTLRKFETFLQTMMLDETLLTKFDGMELYKPSPLFSALFLMEHAYSHFLHEEISLRHVLDWALFRRAHRVDVDWDRFGACCKEYGFDRFGGSMTRVGEFVLGEREEEMLSAIDRRLLESIWDGERMEIDKSKFWTSRLTLIRKTLQSGWKYRAFSNITMIEAILIQVWGFLFERNPQLSINK